MQRYSSARILTAAVDSINVKKGDWLLFPTKRLAFPQSQRKRCLSPVFRCSFREGNGTGSFFPQNPWLPCKVNEKGACPRCLGVLFGKETGLAPFSHKTPGLPAKSAKKVPVPGVPVFFLGRKKGTGTFF
jgi:hypothetical protein